MVGKGDPDRLNKQCSRLDHYNCMTGGPKGICMWIPDETAKQRVLVDLNENGTDDDPENEETEGSLLTMMAPKLFATGFVTNHQILFLVAMLVILMLFAAYQLARRCKQWKEGKKYDGYAMVPDATDDVSSSYFNYMTQSV